MEDGRVGVPESDDPKWVMDPAFLVNITQELNIHNLKLRGPGQLITTTYESVKAFSIKKRDCGKLSVLQKKKASVISQHGRGRWHGIQW